MKTIGVVLHFFLFSFELFIYYMLNKLNIMIVHIQYISNQVEYYRELPIVNITLMITSILIALGAIGIYLYRNKKLNFAYLLIFLGPLMVIFYAFKEYTSAQIVAKYGAEYFFYNFYWFFGGLILFWTITLHIHWIVERYLENLCIKR